MKAKIDAAGRAKEGKLEIEPAPTPMKLVRRGRSLVAVPSKRPPTFTDEQVRETLERVRR